MELFIAEVRSPCRIMSDNAKMKNSKTWTSILTKYNISSSTTEPYHQHQNHCERHIQELKKITTRLTDHTNTPDCLWYEALQYASTLHSHTSKPIL